MRPCPGPGFLGIGVGIPPRGAVRSAIGRSAVAFLPVLIDSGKANIAHTVLIRRLQKKLGGFDYATAETRCLEADGRHFLDGFELEAAVFARAGMPLVAIGIRQPDIRRGLKFDDFVA